MKRILMSLKIRNVKKIDIVGRKPRIPVIWLSDLPN